MSHLPHHEILTNRRDFLRRGGAGFGALALASIMGNSNVLAALGNKGTAINPLQPRLPHLPGTAKRVIFLFMKAAPATWIFAIPSRCSTSWRVSRCRKVSAV